MNLANRLSRIEKQLKSSKEPPESEEDIYKTLGLTKEEVHRRLMMFAEDVKQNLAEYKAAYDKGAPESMARKYEILKNAGYIED